MRLFTDEVTVVDASSRLERARAYCRLVESSSTAYETFDALRDAIVITGPDVSGLFEAITYVNAAFERLSGYERDALVGSSPRMLQGGRTRRDELDRMKLCLADEAGFEGEIINYRRSRDEYVMGWAVAAIKDGSGKPTNWLSVQNDITRDLLIARERRSRFNI